jgi:putative ABC transport system permease protein
MLTTYYKLALRNMRKSPLFTGLNVLGLSVGLAVSLLLFMHVRQELTFDQYHRKTNRIHRVMINAFWNPEEPVTLATAPNVVGPAAKEAIPAVEQFARILHHDFGVSAFINTGTNQFIEENVSWADPGLVDIFDIPTVAGDLKAALSQPNAVALSRSTAVRFFGTSNPVGQTLKIDRMEPLEVKAVYEDFPANSTLNAHILGAFSTIKWANQRLVWSNSSFETWLLLNQDAQPAQVTGQLTALLDKNVPKENQNFSFWLQALPHVHLGSTNVDNNELNRPGDYAQVKILGYLALAILLIACFNYMNLSTAQSQLRFREVGVNKTMGATKGQLAGRFFTETAVLTFFAAFLAWGMMALSLPWFNELANSQLSLQHLIQPDTLLAMFGILSVVVVLAGTYPALLLSSFSPKNLLQTSFRPGSGAAWLRKSMVTAQFGAAVALIVCTLVLNHQLNFLQEKNLGFNPGQVVVITTAAAESKEQLNGLMTAYQQLSVVSDLCRAQTYPGGSRWSGRSITRDIHDTEGMELQTCRVTPDFEKVLDLKMIAGSPLPERAASDTVVNVVLNKKAVDYLGLTPEAVIGKIVNCDLYPVSRVVGVVEDFHAESLHKSISGYAFHDADSEGRRFLLVKLNSADMKQSIQQLETVFKQHMPQSAFEYKFMDDQIDALYKREARTANTMMVFSFLAVLISCLGLFGLAAFAAEQRTKEISIRKVLGASVAGITGLLAKDFLKLVLLAIALSAPLAYYFMQQWLSDFAYRIDIQWWMFVVAGAAALLIAFLTVSVQGIKAAWLNPGKTLRSE